MAAKKHPSPPLPFLSCVAWLGFNKSPFACLVGVGGLLWISMEVSLVLSSSLPDSWFRVLGLATCLMTGELHKAPKEAKDTRGRGGGRGGWLIGVEGFFPNPN